MEALVPNGLGISDKVIVSKFVNVDFLFNCRTFFGTGLKLNRSFLKSFEIKQVSEEKKRRKEKIFLAWHF